MKVKIVFFDCDGVLLFNNPWKKLREIVNMSDELDQQWVNDYYEGRSTFEEWMERLRNFYVKAGLSREKVSQTLGFDLKNLNPQAAPLIDFLREKGIEIAIVSSGAQDYVSKVAKHYGINHYFTNTVFIFDKNDKFVRIDTFGEDPDVKKIQISKLCKDLSVSPQDTIFIGDSSNDYKAFELTEHGTMYGNHPMLAKYAWKTVDNLSEIIDIIKEENGNASSSGK